MKELIARFRADLTCGGPDVVGSDLIALIDDERESDPSRKVLSREEAARVWGLIHRYPSWNDAYWTLLAAMKLSDEMDALPEGSADHAELAQELGSLLAVTPPSHDEYVAEFNSSSFPDFLPIPTDRAND